jgi:threonine dehydrogenase-like Zn-dependent dehydrogenase
MMQAIRSTRPGGHVGHVGVVHGVALPGDELFLSGVHLHQRNGGQQRIGVGVHPRIKHMGIKETSRKTPACA